MLLLKNVFLVHSNAILKIKNIEKGGKETMEGLFRGDLVKIKKTGKEGHVSVVIPDKHKNTSTIWITENPIYESSETMARLNSSEVELIERGNHYRYAHGERFKDLTFSSKKEEDCFRLEVGLAKDVGYCEYQPGEKNIVATMIDNISMILSKKADSCLFFELFGKPYKRYIKYIDKVQA